LSLGRAPLVVLDGAEPADLADAAAALEASGWRIIDRLDPLPLQVDRLVCRAMVDDAESAAAAVLAASWGAGLLIGIGAAADDVRERLLDDLARIGPLDRRGPAGRPSRHPDAARLLELLAEGQTLGEAARRSFLSRRTADRRLAEARSALGAASTAEAISRWSARMSRDRGV
jgi:hypothetical protein